MLNALYQYALRRQLALPSGYAKKTVKAYVSLSSEHPEFVQVFPGGEEAVPCPDVGSLTQSKDKCNVLCEKRSVVAPETETAKHSFFVETLRACAAAEPLASRCADALADQRTAAAIREQLDRCKIKESDRVSFRVDGHSLLESERVQAWWRTYREGLVKRGTGEQTPCLITGEMTQPAVTVPPVSGLQVVGGHASGDTLICFDKAAFCSYGFKQAANAPVSEEAFSAVKAALDDLLRDAPILAGMRFVHWYDQEIAPKDDPLRCVDFGLGLEEEDDGDAAPSPPDAVQTAREESARRRADELVESVRSGERTAKLRDVRYHIALLSGVGGRVMVRSYRQGRYEELQANLDRWHEELSLINSEGTACVAPCKLAARLIRLLKYQKGDKKPFQRLGKELSGIAPAVIQAILTGAPLPDAVAVRALAGIRSSILVSEETAEQARSVPDGWTCQWLKVWLMRRHAHNGQEEHLMASYSYDHPSPAYHCGGLMAVFADVQHTAMPDVDAGVIRRYYASAMQTPALVLSRLSRLSNYHLDKIENGWLREVYDDEIQRLHVRLGDSVPTVLNLEEQCMFSLGYYQMGAQIKADRKARIEAARQRKEQERQTAAQEIQMK